MIEQHMNEDELLCKINELFQYRLFPQLFSESNAGEDANMKFLNRLIDLQKNIYYLDAHLEANWQTDETVLAWHWDNIIRSLCELEISVENTSAYLNHIRKYEKHELELRLGKSPLRFDMEYFYFYKSCDVKLLRRLIYEKFQLSPGCGQLSDWRYYDLVTEVNDDIEDIFEDLDFINGNSFLISLLYKGKSVTQRIFSDFLNEIAFKAKNKYSASSGRYKELIFESTNQRIAETQQLLFDRLDVIRDEQLKESMLFNHQTIPQK